MAKLVISIGHEDGLDGLSNYSPWKERVKMVLLVNTILEFSDKDTKKPTNLKELEVYEDLEVKGKLIILDSVKYHLMHHLIGNNIG